jgi:Na+-transporting methylmalonyl-CoA/oxaloacetate decarboxylase gamma subunit
MNPVAQGISISLLGIATTFIALGLLVLVILVLNWLFPVKQEKPPREPEDQEEERKQAVAIAVAVSLAGSEEEAHPGLGELLEEPPGRWWYQKGLPKS